MLSHMVGGHPAGYQGGYSDYTYPTAPSSGNDNHQYQCNYLQQQQQQNDQVLGPFEQPFQPINHADRSDSFPVCDVASANASTATTSSGYRGWTTPEDNMLPANQQPSASSVPTNRLWDNNEFQAQPHHRPAYSYASPSSSREMRNKAEKQRRDRLNSFIAELATLVPLISRSVKRLDKTSILRLTATHLRIYQTLVKNKGSSQMELPPHVDQFVLEQLICDQMGGFLLILSPINGKIIFVSHTVENLLGHLQTDLMGQSLFTMTASEDHDRLRMYLGCEGEIEQSWKKDFTIKVRRAGPKSEAPHYESVRMMGIHKQPNLFHGSGAASPMSSAASTSSLQTPLNTEVLVFFVKLCRSQPLVDRLVAASKDEYVTRHLIDGRIVACDQRISLIAGYMTDEIQGHSAFQYIHQQDVRYTMIALRQMYDKGESKGNSCYRLKSRNGQFIYVKTFGFLEIDDHGIVESFVCVNVQVDQPEGKHFITEMKRRFRAMFTSSLASLPYDERRIEGDHDGMTSPLEDPWAHAPPVQPPVAASASAKLDRTEDPRTIEAAVTELMQNLPLPGPETPDEPVHYQTGGKSNGARHGSKDISVHNPGKVHHPQIVIKQGIKRSQSESPDAAVQKRQRLNSVESEPPQLSPQVNRLDLPYGNGTPLMPKLEEQFQSPNAHPDVLMHQYHHVA